MSSAFPYPSDADVQPGYLPTESPSEPGLRRQSCSKGAINVGFYERLFSAVAGAGMAAYGLTNAKRGGLVLGALGGALAYRGLTGRCSCYSALGLDATEHNDATVIPSGQGDKVEQSVVINRSPAELYSFWREVENLPKIMRHLEKVEALDRQRSHWVACGPLGKRVEWDAEIFNDRENEVIAWRSLEGSQIETAGSVHFKALGDDRGTALTVSLQYKPPGGKVGAWLASLLGDNPMQMIAEDLQNFKRHMESGELPSAEYPPGGVLEKPSQQAGAVETPYQETP